MLFNSIKEINRLLSKEMSNIYLKVIFKEKNSLKIKNLSPSTFWWTPIQNDIFEFWIFLLQLKNHRFGSRTVCGFSIVLVLKGIITL